VTLPCTLLDLLEERCRLHPTREALWAEDGTATFAELRARALAIAGDLANRGVGRGDRVVLLADARRALTFLSAYLGIHALAAISVPINPRLAVGEIADLLQRVEATVIMTCDLSEEKARLAAGQAQGDAGRVLHVSDALRATPLPRFEDWRVPGPDEVADILFSSGTTGLPKGVVVSHFMLWFAGRRFADITVSGGGREPALHVDDVCQSEIPIYSASTIECFVPAMLHTGSKLVLDYPFDVKRTFERMGEHRTSVWSGLSALARLLTQDIGAQEAARAAGGRLRSVTVGGSYVPPEVWRTVARLWPHATLGNPYGLTEFPIVTMLTGDDVFRDDGGIGRPLPARRLELVPVAQEGVDPGVGMIRVSGPGMMRGYFLDPERTAATIQRGWLVTGDLAVRTEEDRLILAGRVDDRIDRGGYKIWPSEIERAALTHPSVSEAVALGVPHPVLGVDVALAVQPRAGGSIDTA
jgi:long-chain acyl-CoA synthetase